MIQSEREMWVGFTCSMTLEFIKRSEHQSFFVEYISLYESRVKRFIIRIPIAEQTS